MNTPLKKSVTELFVKDACFNIPEYQREYCWDEERCRPLWDDLIDGVINHGTGRKVFLGTFVTNTRHEENGSCYDVVDGQQRITTFFLLLRAGLQYLSEKWGDEPCNTTMEEGAIDHSKWDKLRYELQNALWLEDDDYELNAESPRLRINTPFDSTKEDFYQIIACFYNKHDSPINRLEKLNIKELKEKSRYIQNFIFFLKRFREIGEDKAFRVLKYFLKQFEILHLNCDDEEEALIVFDTLNNRGMQLKDADIFKSHLYKSCTTQNEREDFVSTWNTILIKLKEIENDSLVIDELFHQYVLYVKLKLGDERVDRDVRAVRSFYLDREKENGKYLENHRQEIMDDISMLADMWHDLTKRINFSFEILKWYHCLLKGKNDLWMWAVATYYLRLKNNGNFSEDEQVELFGEFLKRLTAGIYYRCVTMEGAASDNIKDFVFKVINNIGKSMVPKEIFTLTENMKMDGELQKSLINIACGTKGNNPTNDKPYVFIHAYLNPQQTELLPLDTDIEHIFPKSWTKQSREKGKIAGLAEGAIDGEQRQYVEYFGNKICLEKLNNIRCSDDYFANKLLIYENGRKEDNKNVKIEKSMIHDIIDFCARCKAKSNNPTWGLTEIITRNSEFLDKIVAFFKDNITFQEKC